MTVSGEYFSKVAESNNMDAEEVKELYKKAYEIVKSLRGMEKKSELAIERRAKSQLMRMIANRRTAGRKFNFVLIGPLGRPRDWNEPVIKANESMAKTSMKQLMNEGRVFYIEKDGKRFPIKRITSYGIKKVVIDVASAKILDNIDPEEVGEDDKNLVVVETYEVTDGEPWDPIKDRDTYPIWRDNILINESLGTVNYGYGKPLTHNYRFQLLGFGYPSNAEDDLRLLNITFVRDYANPESESFIMKKLSLFKPYEGEFTVLESKCTDDTFVLRFNGAMPTPIQDDTPIEEIVEGSLNVIAERFPNNPYIPEFYDGASGFIEFHEKNVPRDEEGNIIRSKSGYEYTPWNKIAVVLCHIGAVYEPKREGGKPMFRLQDPLLPQSITAYCDDAMFSFPDAGKIPGLFIVSGRTMRSPYVYDRTLRQRVVAEAGNGDITVNIFGMAPVDETVDIEEEGEL